VLLGSKRRAKGIVHCLNTSSNGSGSRPTTRSQSKVNATAVVRNVGPFEITAFDEGFNQLARGLFGYAKLTNKVGS
jgi:hypothetical protein